MSGVPYSDVPCPGRGEGRWGPEGSLYREVPYLGGVGSGAGPGWVTCMVRSNLFSLNQNRNANTANIFVREKLV